MIKNGIRTLMLLGIILVIGVMVKEATAEITIDNDLIISEDLTIQNERVIIIANLTCIGNATLTIDGCMVQMGIVNSSKPAIIQIYNNSSLIIRDSNFSRIVGTAFYQIKIESFGIVEITNSSFYEGGKGSPEFLEIFSISNASLRFDRIKFKDCLAGVTLSNLFNINLTNVSWVHTQKTGMKLIDCTNSVIVDSEINGHMDGVGISVENCEGVFLRNCTFSDNEIGIQSSGGTGFLIVERCTFVRSTRVAIVFVNHGSLSGPEIKNCQFYEDNIGFTTDPLGGLTTHGSIENLLISNCSFNFNTIGITFSGNKWSIFNNSFNYCLIGIYLWIGGDVYISGNHFKDSINCGIFVDSLPDDRKLNPTIVENNFFGGSGSGISLYMGGEVQIISNVFTDLRGGGLLISWANDPMLDGNFFHNCSIGIQVWNIDLQLRNSFFSRCEIGINNMFGSIVINNSLFTDMNTILTVYEGIVFLLSGSIEGGGQLMSDGSTVVLEPDFDMETSSVNLENRSHMIVKKNPSIRLTEWRLNTASILDVHNTTAQARFIIIDADSHVNIWWPIVFRVIRRSDDTPVENVRIDLHNNALLQAGNTITTKSGLTAELDVLELNITNNSIRDMNPHRIRAQFGTHILTYDVNISNHTIFNITLDDVAPIIEIHEPKNGEIISNSSIEIIGIVTDESDINELVVTIDGTTTYSLIPGSPWRLYTNLNDGVHHILVEAQDCWHNRNHIEIRFTIDLFPPSIEVSEPENGAYLSSKFLEVKGHTDPDLVMEVNGIPGRSDREGLFNIFIPIYEEGNQEIRIIAYDSHGRLVLKKIDVNIDWTPPVVIFSKNYSLINTTSLTIEGRVSEPVLSLMINGTTVSMGSYNNFSQTIDLTRSVNIISWKCSDLAGNVGEGTLLTNVDNEINLTLNWPEANSSLNQGWLEVTGRTDPLSRIELIELGIIASSGSTGEFSIHIWSGEIGWNTLHIMAQDPAGNIAELSVDYEVYEVQENPPLDTYWIFIISLIILVTTIFSLKFLHRGRR